MKSTINLGYLVFLSVVAALGGFLFGYDTDPSLNQNGSSCCNLV